MSILPIPKYRATIRREGVYIHWYVFEAWDGRIYQLFTDGLCFRRKTAEKKTTEIMNDEIQFWTDYSERYIDDVY